MDHPTGGKSGGIKVAYLNYEASAPIGAWRSRKFGVDERWTPTPQEFLSGEQLEHYTPEAVASFLHDLPGLWMFGFESESPVNPRIFIIKTYLAALAEAPPSLRIYLRTWVADPQKVRDLAAATNHPGGTLRQRPPYRVLVTDEKPAIQITAIEAKPGTDRVKVSVRIETKSTLDLVRAYYKPMPAGYEWNVVDMQATDAGIYEATLPLTAEGLLYFVEAVDKEGNGSNYPNFLAEPPHICWSRDHRKASSHSRNAFRFSIMEAADTATNHF